MNKSWIICILESALSIMDRGSIYAAILFVAENKGIGKDIFIHKYGEAFYDHIVGMAKNIKE